MSTRLLQTIGAAVGAVVFIMFFAQIADDRVSPLATAKSVFSVTVLP